jgi:hypothetical protein
MRDERPCRRTAKRDNEFSPPDADCHTSLPRGGHPHESDITFLGWPNNDFALRKP